jgi:hypothetical protein
MIGKSKHVHMPKLVVLPATGAPHGYEDASTSFTHNIPTDPSQTSLFLTLVQVVCEGRPRDGQHWVPVL